ncbi:MAG: hypothetical protein KAT65_00465 [Methanophagales archaeon]|nr:hypothetical protein [Methanophagales archaeon]
MKIFDKLFGKEDPTIYTSELKLLRDQLRSEGGTLPCYNCGKKMNVDLKIIEKQIRNNQKMLEREKNNPLIFDRQVSIQPDFKKGAVCKTCKGILCDNCMEKVMEVAYLGYPLCPKCKQILYGIDHITD